MKDREEKEAQRQAKREQREKEREQRNGRNAAQGSVPMPFSAVAELHRQINDLRVRWNVPALKWNSKLANAAAEKARCFERTGTEPITHTCGQLTSAQQRARAGYQVAGAEIVQWSAAHAGVAFANWNTSKNHNAVMRDPQYREIGCVGPTGTRWWGTWVCEFGVGER